MIEWLKQQYIKILFNIFPILPSYIARDYYDEFEEIYDELKELQIINDYLMRK